MDLFALYNDACADNNTQQSGHLRPQRNFNSWVNSISLELFNAKYAQAGTNQKIKDQLDAAFLQSVNIIVTSQPGKDYDTFILPADYAYFSSVRAFRHENSDRGCLCRGKAILKADGTCGAYEDPDFVEIRAKFKGTSTAEVAAEPVDNQKWGPALSHRLKKPSWKRVKVTQTEGLFKIVPKGIGVILLDYYRYPRAANFAYTTNLDGSVNYNLGGSTQLDWPISVKPEFLAGIKQRFASYTGQDNKYQQSMNEKEQTK